MRYRAGLSNSMDPLAQVDTLAPLELLERAKRTTYQEPEKALMFAILRDAITCLEKSGNKRLFDEAMEWILCDDCKWLFSFNNVCEALGFNPVYLRRRLMRWPAHSSAAS